MSKKLKLKRFIVITISLLLSLFSNTASAQMFEDLDVELLPDGYEVILNYNMDLRYVSHSPSVPTRTVRVQLRPINAQLLTDEEIEELRDSTSLAWDKTTGIPL
jgi:hypothetical protein